MNKGDVPPLKNEEQEKDLFKKKYQKIRKIGEGTFAVIYEAKCTETGDIIAIKKIKMGNVSYGIDISAIREIQALQSLKHPNIIQVFSKSADGGFILHFSVKRSVF